MTSPFLPSTDTQDGELPSLHRILSPEEFHQARQMSPEALRTNPFPLLPPAAPRDATALGVPNPTNPNNARPNAGVANLSRVAPDNPHATQLTGRAKAASDAFQAVADHPIKSAAIALTMSFPPLAIAANGLMATDLARYAGQRAAELSLDPDTRHLAEADPERVPGEAAAMDAAFLAVPAMAGTALRTFALSESPAALAVKQHVADVVDAWKSIFAPASRGADAAEGAKVLRSVTGEMAGKYEQAAFKLDDFRRAIDPLPDAEKLNFIDAMEGGRSQATPAFEAAATTIRQTLDEARDAIRALGTGKLEHFIRDYFPHIWIDPERAAEAFAAGPSTGASMEGSKAFLEQREIPTTLEGMRMGLTPVSTNPVDLTLLKLREMQRYLMAHQALSEMKELGIAKYVAAGEQAPDGYARIADKVATVFGPREGGVTLPSDAIHAAQGSTVAGPGGAAVRPDEVGVAGLRIMGEHYAPEPVARLVNNYLSPGLRGNALYDAYRGLGNTLNQAQLGLSAFHLGMTSLDATVSRNALALEYLASGKPAAAVAKFATAPFASLPGLAQGLVGDAMNAKLGTDFQWGLGSKIRAAYLNPEAATPEMQTLANAVKEAGGRVRQDSFYQNSAPEKMISAWQNGEYGKSVGLSLPALFEFSARPIMDHVVPLQKLGVFGEMAQKALAELPAEASLAERRAALSSAWNSVDNRMGQLVYDNLFWNKTVKDLAMASVRSVGWNLGTIRELGGGVADLATNAAKLPSGNAELTHRAAYAAMLPLTVGMIGATYQYLRTGEGPQDLKDYMYPKTGEVDADGNAERVQLPSYMKDFAAYGGHPWETVKHKIAPLPNMLGEMLQNEDYYGDEIRNPNDPAVRQFAQEAAYMAKQVLPFSVQNMVEQNKRGDQTAATKIGGWFGVTPAPRSEVRSDAQNEMADILSSRRVTGATPEDADARKTRNDLLTAMRGGDSQQIQSAVTDAIERHQLTGPDVVSLLKHAGTSPAAEKFKRLTLPQAIDVFQKSTPDEQGKFAQALIAKLSRAKTAVSDGPIVP